MFSCERGESTFVVKDPLSLQYFSLSEVEYFILESLGVESSVTDLHDKIQNRFPEKEYSAEVLVRFLSMLIGSQLLMSTSTGYGRVLAKKSMLSRSHGSRWLARLNILTIRWRGIDPHSMLKSLDSYIGWIYSKSVFVLTLLLFATALATFVIHIMRSGFSALHLQSVFTFQNLPLLLVAIIAIKIIHEIGHGLTCVHYGGECHELGVLFIAFCPLPYCDTTDSWLHENRWDRALVASAGIIVEVFIASICCLLWSISVPGILSLLLFNVMLICSINTLLVNGNPLLRYDGYYVLSDAINYPNLGPEARRLAQSWFGKLIYGTQLSSDVSFAIRRIPVAIFGAASGLYRLFVMMMIIWAVHQILKSYGLGTLTFVIAFPMLASFLFSTVIGVVRRTQSVVENQDNSKRWRAIIGMSLFSLMITIVLLYPLPHTIVAPFSYESGTCRPVFVTVPGRLVSMAEPYSTVEVNSTVAQLVNPDVSLAVERTDSELALRDLHLKNLERFRSSSTTANLSLPAAVESLAIAKDRAVAERQRLTRLTLRSPTSGTLYPTRNVPESNHQDQKNRFWNQTPLAPENVSAWISEQTLLGWVGSQKDFQAVAYVPQHQMSFIKNQAKVRLVFLSSPVDECDGTVIELGNETVQTAPREVFRNNMLAANLTLGQFHPLDTRYRIRISIQNGSAGPLYSTGFAKIECESMSILHRMWRSITHAFALDL